jgi:hypothetical protein
VGTIDFNENLLVQVFSQYQGVSRLRESLDAAKLGVAQSAQRGAVEIDETQPAAA